MNKIKYILVTVIAVLILASTVGIAEENKINAYELFINVKYVEFIDSSAHMKITLPYDDPGTVVYVENYYQTDSYGKKVSYSSRRFEKTNHNGGTLTFDLYRPNDRRGSAYSFVETTVINNKRITNTWWTDLRKYWN